MIIMYNPIQGWNVLICVSIGCTYSSVGCTYGYYCFALFGQGGCQAQSRRDSTIVAAGATCGIGTTEPINPEWGCTRVALKKMMNGNKTFYSAVVMGVSMGGLKALETVLPVLPTNYAMPVIVVQHRGPERDEFLCRHLEALCPLSVIEVEEKMPIQEGYIYIAPPNYHTQVEMDHTFSLSVDPLVHFSRPSVDVLFETAAEAYRDRLVGVVMTGANSDGATGLARIKELGGLTVIQNPETATAPEMPRAAMMAVQDAHVLHLEDMGRFLVAINEKKENMGPVWKRH